MSETYRWNRSHLAAAYNADVELVHPYYIAMQDQLLNLLAPLLADRDETVVDLGAGSGRLVERILGRFHKARAVLVDQSAPFLELAEQRLAPFAGRVQYVQSRLQGDWAASLSCPVAAVVSMSAIHHLEPQEKQDLYRRVSEVLAPGGLFANGDEMRSADDDAYAEQCARWGAHMQRLIDARLVSEPMADALRGWIDRNLHRAATPRTSGDDCHETPEVQRDYLLQAGFRSVETPWQQELWTVLVGRK